MSIKPILFNTDMVQAILDGRKTVTRRVIKPQPKSRLCYTFAGSDHGTWGYPGNAAYEYWGEEYKLPDCIKEEDKKMIWKPPYHADDILYVRETWLDYAGRFMYKADCDKYRLESLNLAGFNWRPSIHMPKEAARIWLKVNDVRVERLRDIMKYPPGPQNQIVREGCKYGCDFIAEWENTIPKANRSKYGWSANPWVWVIEFERCEKPED